MVALKMDRPSLRRGNSIPAVVAGTVKLPMKLQTSSFPDANGDRNFSTELLDWELISLKPSTYTSLKDLLPASPTGIQSPTADRCSCNSSREISIKNPLVKQAAWAYLQPMKASPSSSGRSFFQNLWTKFSVEYVRNPLNACLSFINQHIFSKISQVFHRILDALRFGKIG